MGAKGRAADPMQVTEQICAPVSPTREARVVERPVGIRDVRLTGGPLARWQAVNRDVTFPLALARLESEGNLANLRLAAGEGSGDFRTPIFMDGAVHKMLDAAAWEVVREPDDHLEEFVTLTGELLARAQADDGYLNSYYQVVRPDGRYSQLDRSHEIYLGGLLALAGVARQRGGGAGVLPRVARRFADHLVETFLPGDRPAFDGHPGAEFAFVELYRLTGAKPYLELASKMVEGRGHGRLGTAHGGLHYRQDHLPVREAGTVVGHAVRAMYLEAGIVDVYLETGDRSLLDASVRRWEDLVARKMSLTGGIGSRHRGEAFGEGYELPPDRAYNESCAAFAAVFWNWRLLLATGESRYADMIERLLFNAFAASTSLDGSRFFYINPLQRRDDHREGDDPGRRCEWFACPCCPPNIMRLVSTLGHYLATTNDDGVLLHQYAASEIRVPVRRVAGADDRDVEAVLVIDTDYPWSGSVDVSVAHAPGGEWTLGLRVPAWCTRSRVFVDGVEASDAVTDRGYVRLTRSWRTGEVVRLELDMPARLTYPHGRIDAVRGCVAVERGPLVYCFEQVDQPAGAALPDLVVRPGGGLRTIDHAEHPVLGRTVTIEVDAGVLRPPPDGPAPYSTTPADRGAGSPTTAVAVPYFQWDNRGAGGMRVWLPLSE